MAFDGSVVACLKEELERKVLDGRILKVAQPEKDELILTIKKEGMQHRLMISVNPSLPLMYLTEKNSASPLKAPAFCMLLRKHLQNGRISTIEQPSLERILHFHIEHFNEMGDLCTSILTIELMGKHSNIIFRDETKILDSIKHVSAFMSSVREVLPGREYFIPFEGEKSDPLSSSEEELKKLFASEPAAKTVAKTLYTSYTGISPVFAEEIAYQAGIDSARPIQSLNQEELHSLWTSFSSSMQKIRDCAFAPNIVYDNEVPTFYGPFHYEIYKGQKTEDYESISALLYDYYAKKKTVTDMRQKTADLRQIVQTLLNKDYKKYDLQLKQLKDTEKKEKYQLYGELITAYGYNVPEGSTSMKAENYHNGEEITIPLDPTLSPIDNGKKYFEKYSKLKRTAEALNEIIVQTKTEIDHLESISASLDTVQDEADAAELKKEMIESGYIKYKGKYNAKKEAGKAIKSSPLHYISSDGFDIYVGKNNYQNEYISFKLADGGDWWFHAKNLPGSHVIVKTNGKELPDKTFEEAASLAAHFSKAEGAPKVEIDYVQRKHLKKPAGAKPGYVIYHTNYSMSAETDISGIREV